MAEHVIPRVSYLDLPTSDEESRSHLQSRIGLLSQLLFWSFVALIAFVIVTFELDIVRARHARFIEALGIAGIAILLVVWRGVLPRRQLSASQLFAIDAFYGVSCGVILAGSTYLGDEIRIAPWANTMWACFIVFLRAVVVPSTGRRTVIFGAAVFVPIVLASLGVASRWTHWLTPPAFVAGSVFIGAGVTTLAAIASRTIYGLRRQVSQARQLGQYTLDRKIGEGGMGVVYLAHHALLRRPTAIKLLQPGKLDADALLRFEREVQSMSRLTHANTVAVFDYGRSADGVFYYAMEYLGGGVDLERLVRNHGAQPWGRVVAILGQVCRALQEAHDSSIVHRDVKPANIILCERGGEPDVVKVVDYGLAKEIQRDGQRSTQMIVGTPAFVAPEAITDPDRVGAAADLYAVGGVGYFLLTGKRMFDAKTPLDMCVQHVTATPKRPSELVDIPAELDTLIMQCLAKQPGERPASARALADALAELPAGDWSGRHARAWWDEYRAKLSGVDDAAETRSMKAVTLAIDLSERR